MKKLILASCLLCTSSVFADACTFNLTFNSKWDNFKDWTVIITDISNPQLQEVVGGQLLYYGKFPDSGTLKIPVPNCSKSTQIGIFGHAPGRCVSPTNAAPMTSDSSMHAQAFAPKNFLEGMSHCVGDIAPTDWTNINLEVGSIGKPGDFLFTASPTGNEPDSWTKAQLNATCKNPELNPGGTD